jgi:HAD superfamily hydrolase (TIGR01549 family)
MVKNVIWDVDGTIIDTKQSVIQSLKKLLWEERKLVYKDEDLFFALGIPAIYTLKKLDFENIELAQEKWVLFESQLSSMNEIFDDIESTLKKLKENEIIQGIVTSRTKHEISIDSLLTKRILKYMDYVVCSNDTVKHKPNPEPIFEYIKKSNVLSDETIYIGDSIYDFQCAKSANVSFGLAMWGAVKPDDIQTDLKLNNPLDVLNLF